MQKQKNLTILLSVLLFISLVIAGFFAYQTQQLVNELRVTRDELRQIPTAMLTSDPTANWKTYEDEIYKFSFRYPGNWNVDKSPIGNSPTSKFKLGMYPYLLDISNGISDTYSSITINPEGGHNANLNSSMKLTPFILDDRSANLYKFSPDTGFWFINLNEAYAYPNFSINVTYPDKNIEIINQILSTFKFINQSDDQLIIGKGESVDDDTYFVLNLPEDVKLVDGDKNYNVSFLDSKFHVFVPSTQGGLCPMDESNNDCGYYDIKGIKNIRVLRIWKNKNDVFALNPQGILIGESTLDRFLIVKNTPNNIFSTAEINKWKDILQNINVIKNN